MHHRQGGKTNRGHGRVNSPVVATKHRNAGVGRQTASAERTEDKDDDSRRRGHRKRLPPTHQDRTAGREDRSRQKFGTVGDRDRKAVSVPRGSGRGMAVTRRRLQGRPPYRRIYRGLTADSGAIMAEKDKRENIILFL